MDSEQLARFLAGEMSAPERRTVDSWAASDPEASRELVLLQTAWGAKPEPGRWDVDAAWSRLQVRLDRPHPAVIPLRPSRRVWLWSAAAAVVLVAAGLASGRWTAAEAFVTGPGERRELALADGSAVVLAPESRLEVPRAFGSARQVTLSGRAWFEVRHDAGRPFRVETSGATIEDLGTEFEVVARPGSAPIQVVVVAGSVAVRSRTNAGADRVTLGPRDLVRIPVSGPMDLVHEAPVERLTGWRDGTLTFEDATLRTVAAELTQWYGVEIVVDDSVLAARHVDGPIPTADLDEALAILTTAVPGLAVRREAARVTLTTKGGS